MKSMYFEKFVFTLFSISLIFCTTSYSQSTVANPDEQATVSDFEGNIYKTVKIGSQVWMAENLRSTTYSDGAPIVDSLADNNEYLNEIPNFGRLYSWHALLRGKTLDGAQGVCPTGWHVPMKTEWETSNCLFRVIDLYADLSTWY